VFFIAGVSAAMKNFLSLCVPCASSEAGGEINVFYLMNLLVKQGESMAVQIEAEENGSIAAAKHSSGEAQA
jgi:hypothetical protein